MQSFSPGGIKEALGLDGVALLDGGDLRCGGSGLGFRIGLRHDVHPPSHRRRLGRRRDLLLRRRRRGVPHRRPVRGVNS